MTRYDLIALGFFFLWTLLILATLTTGYVLTRPTCGV